MRNAAHVTIPPTLARLRQINHMWISEMTADLRRQVISAISHLARVCIETRLPRSDSLALAQGLLRSLPTLRHQVLYHCVHLSLGFIFNPSHIDMAAAPRYVGASRATSRTTCSKTLLMFLRTHTARLREPSNGQLEQPVDFGPSYQHQIKSAVPFCFLRWPRCEL